MNHAHQPNRPAVLLTGAGGAALPFLIDHLKRLGYRVLAADMDPQAVGLFLADQGHVIPGGASPEFLPAIRGICERERVDAFVPLVDEEMVAATELEQQGIAVICPRREFIQTCLDKLTLMEKLSAAGIVAPRSFAFQKEPPLPYPFILKPRTGRGSRGVKKITSDYEWEMALTEPSPEKLMIQEYIDGPEFTVSVVVWRDGGVQAVVPKEIISKRGITRLAVTRKNTAIDRLAHEIQQKLRADGPFNMQLRLNREGVPLLFEINPRFSTSISLTLAAGVDELGCLIAQALDRERPRTTTDWKEGLVLLRTTQDRFTPESELKYPIHTSGGQA